MKLWPFRRKESAAGAAISQFVNGAVVHTPRAYGALSKEGYEKNVIAYRCINLIAQSIAGVEWQLMKGDKELENHDALRLIRRPNPLQGQADFMERLVGFFMISGNTYVEGTRLSPARPPIELYSLRPDCMKVIGGPKGFPSKYRYEENGVAVDYDVDPLSARSNICHMKTFHPTNNWYGLAPIEAGAFSIDQHNAAGEFNAALLQNRAVPSGALTYKTNPGDDEMKRVQRLLIDRYATPRNAGKPMVLGGDVEWKEFAKSARDIEFSEGRLQSARDIAAAFGVPPQLLGIPGDNTYRNMEEARLMLWDETILPLLALIRDNFLNGWLLGFYNEKDLSFDYDCDSISALIPRRSIHREAVLSEFQGGVITRDEARAALGYDVSPKDGVFYGDNQVSDTSTTPKKFTGNPTERKGYLDSMMYFVAPEEIEDPTLKASVTSFTEALFGRLVKRFGEDVVREVGERVGFQQTADVSNYVSSSSAQLISNINATTKKRIREQIGLAFDNHETIAQMKDRIESVFSQATSSRAQTIAVTESTRIAGYAADEALSQAGVVYKEWLAVMDGHTRDAHAAMDGQIVPADGKFTAPGGQKTDHPGGFGVARLDINCRCAISAAYPGEKARNDYERREAWVQREKARQSSEKEIVETFVKIFTMQRQAVMQRVNAIVGE